MNPETNNIQALLYSAVIKYVGKVDSIIGLLASDLLLFKI